MLEDCSVLWIKTVLYLLDLWQPFIWWSNGATNKFCYACLRRSSENIYIPQALGLQSTLFYQRCRSRHHTLSSLLEYFSNSVLLLWFFSDQASAGWCLKRQSRGEMPQELPQTTYVIWPGQVSVFVVTLAVMLWKVICFTYSVQAGGLGNAVLVQWEVNWQRVIFKSVFSFRRKIIKGHLFFRMRKVVKGFKNKMKMVGAFREMHI